MLSPKEFQELYISMYEGMSNDAKEMRRLAAAERRAGNSDRMDAKTAAKYAGSEAKSAEREDKKSKGKHIHGYAIGESAVGDRARNAVTDQRIDDAQRDTQSSVDKLAKREKVTRASASLAAKRVEGDVRKSNNYGPQRPKPGTTGAYRTESAVPGKPAEKLGAVTSIPKDEQDAARQRTLAKAAAMRAKKGITKEELELELRAHLRERALDASEKKEKESVYKAIKPSNLAKSYPEKSPKELKSLRYAISTAQAKKNMDTSRSDKRYGVER